MPLPDSSSSENQERRLTPSMDTPKNEPNFSPNDDELFIKKTIQTDPSVGIQLIFKRYYQSLCSHTLKFVLSKQVAEDIVSDVLYDFYSKELYKTIHTSYRSYLFKSVRHRAFDYLKQQVTLSLNVDAVQDQAQSYNHEQSPDKVSEYEELQNLYQQAIDALPAKRKHIYLLNKIEEKSYKEIAEALQLSVKTVEVQLYRAFQSIREYLLEKNIF